MLRIDSLETGYGRKQVIFGVDLEVRPGEILAIIGPNGSGKSTLLKTVIGLLPVWRGDIRYMDSSLNGSAPMANVARGISFCPQGSRVFDELSVSENLEIGAYPMPRTERPGRIAGVLDLFPELRERLGEVAGRLSGGQQQMLAVARALVPDPGLLLLDEPSLGLAPELVERAFGKVIEINRETGCAVLVVEQKVREVLSIADRVIGLKLGRSELEATPSELEDGVGLKELFLS